MEYRTTATRPVRPPSFRGWSSSRYNRGCAPTFAHSPIRPFAHSPIRSFAHSPIRPFAHSPIRSFAYSLIRLGDIHVRIIWT
ncbi:MAG: hypothetical protein COS85_16770 [Armatimonadetes bacterium CG07_land_8_20_14_0_80_59_28]|nr:MAG: hypothetical protein COS85_16770 [Armatimonadetes bacterium CG07_land_8_20_14_0_80_59_28]